jgi:hypothetical protein
MRRRLISFIAGAAFVAPATATAPFAALVTIVALVTFAAPLAAQQPGALQQASAQQLAARVNAAPANATVRFSFESKPGVCGDGDDIMVRRGDDVSYIQSSGGRSFNISNGRISSGRNSRWTIENCEEGPVRMELERSNGRITAATLRVGGTDPAGATDLGSFTADAAIGYMLGDAIAISDNRPAERMIFAATLAHAESWPGLLRLARQREIDSKPRNSAIFWLAQAAGEKATEGLVSLIGDNSDEIEVRKHAVFALSQVKGEASIDALIDIARTNREPEIRKSAMFWLGQSKNPRVLAFFEEILRG